MQLQHKTLISYKTTQAALFVTWLPACLPQLAVGDSSLRLAFNRLRINGTFTMGTPACPIASSITVTVPGGDETYGVDNAGSYDVHGVMQVGQGWCLNGLSAA